MSNSMFYSVTICTGINRMSMSSVDLLPSIAYDRPRRFIKQSTKKLANTSSSASYRTNLINVTCEMIHRRDGL